MRLRAIGISGGNCRFTWGFPPDDSYEWELEEKDESYVNLPRQVFRDIMRQAQAARDFWEAIDCFLQQTEHNETYVEGPELERERKQALRSLAAARSGHWPERKG